MSNCVTSLSILREPTVGFIDEPTVFSQDSTNQNESNPFLNRLRNFRIQLINSCDRIHLKPVKFFPTVTLIQICIFSMFCLNFWSFYISLETVTIQENVLSRLEPTERSIKKIVNQTEISYHQLKKSKFLSLVLTTLVAFPFDIFGMVAVAKRSFTLVLTFSIIIFIILCFQLRSVLSIEAEIYFVLCLVQFILFCLISLFDVRLYYEKILKRELN